MTHYTLAVGKAGCLELNPGSLAWALSSTELQPPDNQQFSLLSTYTVWVVLKAPITKCGSHPTHASIQLYHQTRFLLQQRQHDLKWIKLQPVYCDWPQIQTYIIEYCRFPSSRGETWDAFWQAHHNFIIRANYPYYRFIITYMVADCNNKQAQTSTSPTDNHVC